MHTCFPRLDHTRLCVGKQDHFLKLGKNPRHSQILILDSRDPWWLFTTVNLIWNIKCHYGFSLLELIWASPRFGVLLLSMCLSIAFIILDVLSVTPVLDMGGINPFWKFAFVFKCLTDTIFLDDFKTVLDRLWEHKMGPANIDVSSKLELPSHIESKEV